MKKHIYRSEVIYPGNHLKNLSEAFCRNISKFKLMIFGMKYPKYIIYYRISVGTRLVVTAYKQIY